jgi:hypothetical protein
MLSTSNSIAGKNAFVSIQDKELMNMKQSR